MRSLRISDLASSSTLSLPLDAVTSTFALLAVRGAGKSNAARVMAEEMFKAGLPFVVVDPVGSWRGLRSGRAGDKKGGLPIPIFGGKFGDVQLERGSGAVIADLIVDKRLSCVVDLSNFASEADKKAFLLAFAQRLYQRNEDPLHLFLEEADDYIPQKPMKDELMLLRAWENIVRRGRARGLGCTLITQRSAAINKMVLTQVETLFVLRTTGPQDIKAIDAWVKYHQVDTELLRSLAGLDDGEAWVWSPHYLKKTIRFRFRMSETFDSGATPKNLRGNDAKPASTLVDVDLESIRDQIASTIEKAKADDPRELRKRIAELERKNAQREPRIKTVEAISPASLSRLEKAVDKLMTVGIKAVECARDVLAALPADSAQPKAPIVRLGNVVDTRTTRTPKATAKASPSSDDTLGNTGLRRMLIALAQRPQGLTPSQLGIRSGISTRGRTFPTYLSKGRTSGWIAGNDHLTITSDGLKALGTYDPLPTGRKLLAYWLEQFGGSGAGKILRVVADAYPNALDYETVGSRTEIDPAGRTFPTYVSKLRTLELIEGKAELRANKELFS